MNQSALMPEIPAFIYIFLRNAKETDYESWTISKIIETTELLRKLICKSEAASYCRNVLIKYVGQSDYDLWMMAFMLLQKEIEYM